MAKITNLGLVLSIVRVYVPCVPITFLKLLYFPWPPSPLDMNLILISKWMAIKLTKEIIPNDLNSRFLHYLFPFYTQVNSGTIETKSSRRIPWTCV
jgi:hypothetical protein